ncbi:MAG: hypothetical protein M3164_00320 [Actinomycetota bacterium]|nr:hypothetical protein [Actinomycetota bacterium]
MDPTFIKGLLAFVVMMIVFVGSVWLLLSMILGARLGYFVMASCFFGVMILISAIWFVTTLGPKGPDGFLGSLGEETGWQPIAVGPQLGTTRSPWGTFDLSDYPEGDWQEPSRARNLADLEGPAAAEVQIAHPVMEALVLEAVSEIPGVRRRVEPLTQGDVALPPDDFEVIDIRMKEADIAGKESVIAVGRAVPTATLNSGALNNAPEAEVTRLLLEPGDQVSPGMPLMTVTTPDGAAFDLTADRPGALVEYGFRIGDNIKPNVPFATIDISGQPGVPQPVEVSAVRVRGSIRVPAFIYLVASVILFVVHLAGVRRTEEALRGQPQAA